MSHPSNDLFLERANEDFANSEDGKARREILERLKDSGFEDAYEDLLQLWLEERKKFLEEVGVDEKDVLSDEDGEYYIQEVENGNPGEDGYGFMKVRRSIPDYLDIRYYMGWLD